MVDMVWCVGGCAPTPFLSCSQLFDLYTQKPWPVQAFLVFHTCSRKVGPLEMRWLEEQRSRVLSQKLAFSMVSFCWIRLFIHSLCRIYFSCGLLSAMRFRAFFLYHYWPCPILRFFLSKPQETSTLSEWVKGKEIMEIQVNYVRSLGPFQVTSRSFKCICMSLSTFACCILAWLFLGCCDPHLLLCICSTCCEYSSISRSILARLLSLSPFLFVRVLFYTVPWHQVLARCFFSLVLLWFALSSNISMSQILWSSLSTPFGGKYVGNTCMPRSYCCVFASLGRLMSTRLFSSSLLSREQQPVCTGYIKKSCHTLQVTIPDRKASISDGARFLCLWCLIKLSTEMQACS